MANSKRAAKPKKMEPTWLVHFHYGPHALPLTVYDNHDGTYTYADDDKWMRDASAEEVLKVFTHRVNSLVLDQQRLKG